MCQLDFGLVGVVYWVVGVFVVGVWYVGGGVGVWYC